MTRARARILAFLLVVFILVAWRSQSDIAKVIAGIVFFGIVVVLGVLSWQGKIARDVPRDGVMWMGPGAMVIGGTGFVLLGVGELARELLDISSSSWLIRTARIAFGVLTAVALVYGYTNTASWFPDRFLPIHHRRRPPPEEVARRDAVLRQLEADGLVYVEEEKDGR